MNILVVGLGSMGKRRIRLLRDFFGYTACGVDSNPQRREEAASALGIQAFSSIAEAVASCNPEAAFVSTSPRSHSAIINELLNHKLHVFTEINLVPDGYEQNTALARQNGVQLFLSSTQMYRKEIQYIENTARGKTGLRYRYHIGQYLPDWHPWESYKDFFVADKATSAIREIFAIELPWLAGAFGQPELLAANSAKLTDLSLDYNDFCFATLRHDSGAIGQIAFDVVSRKAVREFELIGDGLYLRWGGTPGSLFVFDPETKTENNMKLYDDVVNDPRYADNIVENAYVDEMQAFFDMLAGKQPRRNSFEQDQKLLALITKIESGA